MNTTTTHEQIESLLESFREAIRLGNRAEQDEIKSELRKLGYNGRL